MVANQSQHDVGEKTLLNGTVLPAKQSAAQDLDDAIDNIVNDPNVGPFISKQLIQHLVTSNPSPAYVARVASVFNGDLGSVAGRSEGGGEGDPARSGGARRPQDRPELRPPAHPALFITNLLRAFHARSADGTGPSDGYLNPQAVNMGMDVFRPPSVFSYFSPSSRRAGHRGRARAGVRPVLDLDVAAAHQLRQHHGVLADCGRAPTRRPAPRSTCAELQSLAATPDQLVEQLNLLLLHGTMSAAMRDSILRAVTAVAATNPLKRARTALYLVASSSQYQVEK